MSKIPPKAKREARERLLGSMEIYADDIVEIFARYNVREDPEMLQTRFRRRLAQQYMASFRDENGNRMVHAVRDEHGKIKYTVVDACNDMMELQNIRHRLHTQASGLKVSEQKVKHRINGLERLLRCFKRKEAS